MSTSLPSTFDPKAQPAATERPFIRFYHSERLRAKTLATLVLLEQARDCTRHHSVLSELVLELTECGLDYYFLRPLRLIKAGFWTEQSATLGFNTIMQMASPLFRQIMGRMTATQLLGVCQHIRELMA